MANRSVTFGNVGIKLQSAFSKKKLSAVSAPPTMSTTLRSDGAGFTQNLKKVNHCEHKECEQNESHCYFHRGAVA